MDKELYNKRANDIKYILLNPIMEDKEWENTEKRF